MKSIHFVTPTLLSYIDLISMGGSDKEGDSSKIGVFCSGLKYSMALALRNNVEMRFSVYDTEPFGEEDRDVTTTYSVETYTEVCEQTGKEKELISLYKDVSKQSFNSQFCEDLGGGDFPTEELKTGYSVNMGLNWLPWMILREIYSNMVDEGGHYKEDTLINPTHGTVVTLSFEENSEFADIWNNRHLYINEKEPLHILSDKVSIIDSNNDYLRIYKQNILVYEDRDKPSRYSFNIGFGTIDERRVLSDLYGVEGEICDAVMATDNEDFLREIITSDFKASDDEFLSSRGTYYGAGIKLHDIALEVSEKEGSVNSYSWLISAIKKRKDCKLAGRKLENIGDHLWTYSSTVTVDSTPIEVACPPIEVEGDKLTTPFAKEIEDMYNFTVDVVVTKAKLTGSKCIADKYNTSIIIDEDFNIEEDFGSFLVQYLDLTMKGNVLENLGNYLAQKLKKMITEKRLKDILDKLEALGNRTSILYENGMDIINFENDYHEVFDLLFAEIFNEEQKELFDWWRFEKDPKMWDKHGNVICDSFESMYELLKEYNE